MEDAITETDRGRLVRVAFRQPDVHLPRTSLVWAVAWPVEEYVHIVGALVDEMNLEVAHHELRHVQFSSP